MKIKRSAGILMSISSLPNEYGIGTFGESAYQFVNFLKKANQTYWQILPLGHTSYGDSPYQTFSAFAGNPYFIDLDLLASDNLLSRDEYRYMYHVNSQVDYGFVYYYRYQILRLAHSRFIETDNYYRFIKENVDWLNDYAIFMSLKDYFKGASWLEWDIEYKKRNKKVLKEFIKTHKKEISFWYFIQYKFYEQWTNLKKYANDNGIKIIGDMPIYVAMDSCDVWANPKYFQLDSNLNPIKVAGCPPDDFSEDGQLWGNPVYNYEKLEKDNYSWWIKRMKSSLEMFDIVRIDHFRGFEAFWSIPYGDTTAKGGTWVKGPNVKLFNTMEKELGDMNIIAEDLGFLTEGVYEMINKLGYPGMKILEFGFDPWGNSDHAPHNVTKNCIVYPSSHDLPTIKDWFYKLPYENKKYVMDYLMLENEYRIVEAIIKRAYATSSILAIVPMQDFLELGEEGRMNTPSTSSNNWKWRAYKEQINDELAYRIASWTKQYYR